MTSSTFVAAGADHVHVWHCFTYCWRCWICPTYTERYPRLQIVVPNSGDQVLAEFEQQLDDHLELLDARDYRRLWKEQQREKVYAERSSE